MRVEILLREIRKERKITLDTLAKITGMSKGHLSRIERKETEPTITSLARIALALKVDITELYKIIK
jgi:transcriptional regulator with XRE-family HTH domain